MRALLWSYLGGRRLPRELSACEVRQFYLVSPEDRYALRRRFRARARLGTAVQLGFVRMTGAVFDILDHVPRPVLAYVDHQLGLAAPVDRVTTIFVLARQQAPGSH